LHRFGFYRGNVALPSFARMRRIALDRRVAMRGISLVPLHGTTPFIVPRSVLVLQPRIANSSWAAFLIAYRSWKERVLLPNDKKKGAHVASFSVPIHSGHVQLIGKGKDGRVVISDDDVAKHARLIHRLRFGPFYRLVIHLGPRSQRCHVIIAMPSASHIGSTASIDLLQSAGLP